MGAKAATRCPKVLRTPLKNPFKCNWSELVRFGITRVAKICELCAECHFLCRVSFRTLSAILTSFRLISRHACHARILLICDLMQRYED